MDGIEHPADSDLAAESVEPDSESASTDATSPDLDVSGWTLNVCHGGMRIITESPLKKGETIALSVQSSGRAYAGQATVCWVREQADGVIAGLEFHRAVSSPATVK
jgi:PilZ domain